MPKYIKMESSPNDLSEVFMTAQLAIIWVIWFLNQFLLLVIMLNFLISVISDTYVRVSAREKMYRYHFRNQLNINYFKIVDNFYPPEH